MHYFIRIHSGSYYCALLLARIYFSYVVSGVHSPSELCRNSYSSTTVTFCKYSNNLIHIMTFVMNSASSCGSIMVSREELDAVWIIVKKLQSVSPVHRLHIHYVIICVGFIKYG